MHWKIILLGTNGYTDMKFKVNGLDWEIQYKDSEHMDMNDGDYVFLGTTKIPEQVIWIRTGMTEILTRRTVIHELCHCFLFSYGCKDTCYDEEQLCDFVGSYLGQINRIMQDFMNDEERGE